MNREQIRDLVLFSVVLTAVGVLMRIFYPQPFLFYDSYTYISTAVNGSFDIFRPNGYPHYLRLIHSLHPTLGFLFLVNYLLFALSSLLLLFSARQVLQIRNEPLFLILGFCTLLSARLIFSTNYMMSDGIFCTLGAVFFASCLQLIRKPSWGWSAVNLLTLWLMCKLRYGGLFFIPATAVVFYLSLRAARHKIVPVLAACVPLVLGIVFYQTTKKEYEKQTGVAVFSGFGGWQKINNALVLFPEAKELKPSVFKREVRPVHKFMSMQPDEKFKREYAMATKHMWDNNLPCKEFAFYICGQQNLPYGPVWVGLSQGYGEYADALVKKYPFRYVGRYFLPSLWSSFRFTPIIEESIPVEEKDLLGPYYGVDYQVYEHQHKFFAKVVDPVRRVLNVVYWIAAVLALAFFFYALKKGYYAGTTKWSLLALALLFICIIGGQAVSSPCTTWRYTMSFYQASIIFIFVNLWELVRRLTQRDASASAS